MEAVCWCGRARAYGTEVCYYHGARRLEVQVAADTRRLEEWLAQYRCWLQQLEVRWVRCGGSPGDLARLVLAGREAEAAGWVERVEAGW